MKRYLTRRWPTGQTWLAKADRLKLTANSDSLYKWGCPDTLGGDGYEDVPVCVLLYRAFGPGKRRVDTQHHARHARGRGLGRFYVWIAARKDQPRLGMASQ